MLILRLNACDRYPLGRSRSHVIPAGVAAELAQLQAQLKRDEELECSIESGNRQLALRVAKESIRVRNQQAGTWLVIGGESELREKIAALAVFA